MASARGHLDGSDCCLNMMHMNPILLRWITRSAYDIPGNVTDDLIYGMFLPCCTINQVLQTTRQYRRPYPGSGKEANGLPFSSQNNKECFADCIYSTFCLPCAIGTTLNTSTGMPFLMGCLCSNYCIARNIVRYQYRLQGNDCWDDCATPYAVCVGGCIVSFFCPCAEFIICPYMVSMVMMMLGTAKERGNPKSSSPNGSYLFPMPNTGIAFTVPNNLGGAIYATATMGSAPMVNAYMAPSTASPPYFAPVSQPGIQMQPTVINTTNTYPTPYPATYGMAPEPMFAVQQPQTVEYERGVASNPH